MRRVAYSNITRVLAFILQEILVVTALVNLYMIVNDGIDLNTIKEAFTTSSFFETDIFSDEFGNDISKAAYFAKCSKDLEVDGKFDKNKAVTISDFYNGNIALETFEEYANSQYYIIGDLLDWVNIGISYVSLNYLFQGAYNINIDERRVYYEENELYYRLNDERIAPDYVTDINNEEQEYKNEELKESTLSGDVMVLKEEYTSIDGNMLWYFRDWSDSNMYMSNVLESALDTLKEEYNYYTDNKEQYRDWNNMGFKVYIADGNGNVIVNNAVRAGESYEDVFFSDNMLTSVAYSSKSDKYEVYNTNSAFADKIYQSILEDSPLDGAEYFIVAGINNDSFNYSYNSSYLEKQNRYENAKIYINRIIISMVAVIAAFSYLVIVSGRKYGSDEIKLNSFDEIKTEIAALMVIVPAFLVLIIINKLTQSETVGLMGMAICESILFTWGFVSLVKRFKARQFWSNSLIYAVYKLISEIWFYRKSATKTIICYSAYVILSAFLLMEAFRYRIFLAFLIWLAITIQVGILQLKSAIARQRVMNGIDKITSGELDYKIDCENFSGESRKLADAVNNIGEGLHNAVDASMRNERLKTDLITNVSHDIKTPLTSIINYVDLIKRENIEDEKIKGYIQILDSKSQRLKHLTEDLVEASKISSGNITLEMTKINLVELINQTEGEFGEKFEAKNLNIIKKIPEESVVIEADGRRIWRVIENLYNNVAKYAMSNTRVYIDLEIIDNKAQFSIKNISENSLNINADVLTERFIRGDVSRSTEGSGLGLSIAKNLTELQKGEFVIYLDGDLFKVTITFPLVEYKLEEIELN